MDSPNQQNVPFERAQTVEAALGKPNWQYASAYDGLLVPYLFASWREVMIVAGLAALPVEDQGLLVYGILHKRLPELSYDAFLDATSTEGFIPWWSALRAGAHTDAEGKASAGPPPSRTWRIAARK
jgi:hypothetical protein